LQGKQKQQKRTNTFFEFVNAKAGILLCTDVAARGLDIPQVDYMIPQMTREIISTVWANCAGG